LYLEDIHKLLRKSNHVEKDEYIDYLIDMKNCLPDDAEGKVLTEDSLSSAQGRANGEDLSCLFTNIS